MVGLSFKGRLTVKMMEGINPHGKTKCSQKLFVRNLWSISRHHTSKVSRYIISHFKNTCLNLISFSVYFPSFPELQSARDHSSAWKHWTRTYHSNVWHHPSTTEHPRPTNHTNAGDHSGTTVHPRATGQPNASHYSSARYHPRFTDHPNARDHSSTTDHPGATEHQNTSDYSNARDHSSTTDHPTATEHPNTSDHSSAIERLKSKDSANTLYWPEQNNFLPRFNLPARDNQVPLQQW